MTEGFSERLHRCLEDIRRVPQINRWQDYRLSSVDFSAYGSLIVSIYDQLASVDALHPEKYSHVAATKVLHWLFPDLFLMLDSNVATTFRTFFGVKIHYVNASRLLR